MTSPGPVFYRSERVDWPQSFQMIKFRTMVVDADQRLAEIAHLNESDGLLFKMKRDPRVTTVGRISVGTASMKSHSSSTSCG